ncbi:family 5 glycoside hydrolase [Melampsora americana]|nr:family 5 glycoside hydrolase [Melampsora americana]
MVFFSAVRCSSIPTEATYSSGFATLQKRETGTPQVDQQLAKGSQKHFHPFPRVRGVNVAGLEFGINSSGNKGDKNLPPDLTEVEDFIKQGFNIIRIPFGWQFIQPKVKGELDPTQLALLDKYVNAVLAQKAYVVIDLHNYARLEGKIIGQSEVGADDLVDLWKRLAEHYKDHGHVIFGLMNEPHDVDSKTWIGVLQKVVTAVREAGAIRQKLLLPGNSWSHLATFADDYKLGLSGLKNPDGSHHGLIFDIHQYFDAGGSGTSRECSEDHIAELNSVTALLKKDGRQALITELGGGNTQSCTAIITKFMAAVEANYPTILGGLIWGGGSFAPVCDLSFYVCGFN